MVAVMSAFHRWWPVFLVLALVSPASLEAKKVKFRLRFQAGTEYDSNALRQEGGQTRGDWLTRLHLRSRLTLSFSPIQLELGYQAAGRLYYRQAAPFV